MGIIVVGVAWFVVGFVICCVMAQGTKRKTYDFPEIREPEFWYVPDYPPPEWSEVDD